MLLEVVKYPDPRLALPSENIDAITDELRRLAEDMIETMYEAPGVGLAAPQIGRNIRLMVIDPLWKGEERNPLVLCNPVLTLSGEEVLSEQEGCLSVPLGYRADVKRFSNVHVAAMGIDGEPLSLDFEGFPAFVVQHEYDHLEGRLFIDRIGRLRRSLFDGRMKKCLKRTAD